ncbi:MAG: hypothetical protein ACI8UO_005603 [Verrucomicrobiales bacterium]|jgi:hypothetical protein
MKTLLLLALLSFSFGCATSQPPVIKTAEDPNGNFTAPEDKSIEDKLQDIQRQTLAPYY